MRTITTNLFYIFICIFFSAGMTVSSQDYDTRPQHTGQVPKFENNTDFVGPNTWCPLNTFSSLSSATYFDAAAWINDTMYVQIPSSLGTATNTIMRYTWNGSWTVGVHTPNVVVGGTLTACNGKLYYIGGAALIQNGSNTTYEYNPVNGHWTAKANLPASLSTHGAECWGDSVIFVYGGPYNTTGSDRKVYYYRPAQNTWGTINNSLPSGSGRRTFAHGIYQNKLFMAGGYAGSHLNTFYIGTIGSNASQITWTQSAPLSAVLSRAGGWAGYGKFYMVCGEQSSGLPLDAMNIYNISSGTWSTVAGKPKPVSNIFSCVTGKLINDTLRIFVPAGYDGNAANSINNLDVFKGSYIAPVGVNNNHGKIPSSFSLSQNYPNPFNPSTKISFELPKASIVKIAVYDIAGKEIAVLVNDIKQAGTYEINYDASKLSSGIYLYRIYTDGYTDTKKMMLVK